MTEQKDDIVTQTLKKRYFELCGKEDIVKGTPTVTKELDELEAAIKQRCAEHQGSA